MNGSKNKREVDRLTRSVSGWWKKSLRYATIRQVMTWKALLLVLFAVGTVSGIIWSVALKIENRSGATTGSATLNWTANAEADLAGYNVYYGTSPRAAACPKDAHGYASKVNVGKTTTYTINNLTEGRTYYFSTSAYDTSGLESCFSSEVSKLIPVTADTIKPTVSITSPVPNTTVSGTVMINVNAADNVGVTKVEFYSGSVLKFADTSAPYSYDWDTTVPVNGVHQLTAKAYDAAGNFETSAAISVTVNNVGATPPPPPVDTTAPTVTILKPADGATVSGTVAISASAKDDAGVASMEVYVDNVKVATATGGSISYNWNTRKADKGAHVIMVKAIDVAKNIESVSKNVTTANIVLKRKNN